MSKYFELTCVVCEREFISYFLRDTCDKECLRTLKILQAREVELKSNRPDSQVKHSKRPKFGLPKDCFKTNSALWQCF